MGNDSKTAFKTREQLRKYVEIARSLQEDALEKKTQERLERHLKIDGLDAKVLGSILMDAAPSIREDTLVIIDPSDIQKEYAEKMEYLAKVWDTLLQAGTMRRHDETPVHI